MRPTTAAAAALQSAMVTAQQPSETIPPAADRAERPKTARRAPPKARTADAQEVTAIADESASVRVIADDSVKPSNADDDEDDQTDIADQPWLSQAVHGDDENRGDGMLMQRIMEVQAKEDSQLNKQRPVAASASAGSAQHSAQNEQLRALIQRACQHIHPLGKCIDYVQDDMDQMQRELAEWRRQQTDYDSKLEQERKSVFVVECPQSSCSHFSHPTQI